MRVGVRAVDDARDLDVVAAELARDAAPEVLGGDDLQDVAVCAAGGHGPEEQRREHRDRREDASAEGKPAHRIHLRGPIT